MSAQLNELRLQVEKLEFDNKESVITVDILKEQNADARNELDELKRTIAELKSSQKDPSAEDKEKKKQEKMALMMAQFDMARITSLLSEISHTDNTPNICRSARSVF
jgi:kinesin family protein 5